MANLTCSIDLGNWYIKWVLFLEDFDEKRSIIAKEFIKTKWLKKWKILDSTSLINSISTVLDNLSKKIDSPIDEIILWISHPNMKIKNVSTHKRLTHLEITEKEVNSLLETLSQEADELNYEIIKIIPIKWIIDDTHQTKNPIWMEWRKLELVANVFMIPSNTYKDLEKIFDELEIDIIDIIPNILWGEEWTLDTETKDLWCVLIDIWANQTSFSIYEEWVNLGYWIIPIWWEEITKDISIGLKVDFVQAEQIKKEQWEIILNKSEANIENSEIDKLFLSEIIEARLAEDIYKPILEKLNELNLAGKLPWWIILIWWWAKIKNIEWFTREYFQLACKIWKIQQSEFAQLWQNPLFINVIWNYIWEEKYWDDQSWPLFNINFWGLSKILDWIKKIF